MVHALPAASSNSAGNPRGGGIPEGWSAPTGGLSAANPFASFSVVIGDEKPDLPRNSAVLASAPAADRKQPFTSLDQIPSDWFQRTSGVAISTRRQCVCWISWLRQCWMVAPGPITLLKSWCVGC